MRGRQDGEKKTFTNTISKAAVSKIKPLQAIGVRLIQTVPVLRMNQMNCVASLNAIDDNQKTWHFHRYSCRQRLWHKQ